MSSSNPQKVRDDVVDALAARAKRRDGGVALRTSLAQGGTQSKPVHGPLHKLVKGHDERALDLYLMLRLVASSDAHSGAWDVALPARTWANGLALPTAVNDGTEAVSKTWRRLAEPGLVDRDRLGRTANITVLNEAGNGADYTYPSGHGEGRYFKLSEQFWTTDERWYRTLSLPEKAMLLIASSLKPGFVLPQEQVPNWYGLSPDTAARGLRGLQQKGLLVVSPRRRKAPLAPKGYVLENTYTLLHPFAQERPTKLATVTQLITQGKGA